jgi:hypothetical protein
MGWRESAERLKTAALDSAERMKAGERAQQAKDAAASGIERARRSEVLTRLDTAALKDAALNSAAVTNREGTTKLWRVAKAAANPTATATKVVKAVGKEVIRQQRDPLESGACDGSSPCSDEGAEAAAEHSDPEAALGVTQQAVELDSSDSDVCLPSSHNLL